MKKIIFFFIAMISIVHGMQKDPSSDDEAETIDRLLKKALLIQFKINKIKEREKELSLKTQDDLMRLEQKLTSLHAKIVAYENS